MSKIKMNRTLKAKLNFLLEIYLKFLILHALKIMRHKLSTQALPLIKM